jgi:nicotinate-nucleotide adenylyltransferase
LAAAVNAKAGAHLDKVLMVVANIPWQKEGLRKVQPAAERLALVRAAVSGVEGLEASDIEIRRGGESYTVDTVLEIRKQFPADELFLIIGADVASELETWERADDLADLVTLVIVNRPGSVRPSNLGERWNYLEVEVPALDISSTDLRARAIEGRPLDYLIPSAAIDYIRKHKLYVPDEE